MTKQSPGHSLPIVPTYQELPHAKPRAVRGGPELAELHVRLEVVTPILGGSHQTRALDNVDVIRVSSVRGHLRSWWRALFASQFSSAKELYKRESELWGRAATGDGGRSAVEIRVNVNNQGSIVTADPLREAGAYALWPARAPSGQKDHVPRRTGTKFCLTLKVAEAPKIQVMSPNGDAVELSAVTQVRNALREKVPVERLPEPLRNTWATRANDGVVAIGLQDAYVLLAGLGNPVGTKFQGAGLSGTKSPLIARNRSILAHGFERVSDAVFDKLWTSALSLADVDATSLPFNSRPRLPT